MSVPVRNIEILSVLLVGLTITSVSAQTNRKSAPIIFSAPQSDSVSSNLNDIRVRGSSLLELESGFARPFEVLDANRAANARQSATKFKAPPPQMLDNKKVKDLLDKRAEELYLRSDEMGKDQRLLGDDLLKSSNEEFGLSKSKPKTALDRYYDRMEQSRAGLTNGANPTGLFGDQPQNSLDALGGAKSAGLFPDNNSAAYLRSATNGSALGKGFDADATLKPRGFGDTFGSETSDRIARNRESRLDEYKRLLNGPSPTPVNNNSYLNPSATLDRSPATAPPSYPGATPTWSSSSSSKPKETFATSAGLIGDPGKPQALPDTAFHTVGQKPIAPVEPPKVVKPSTFSLPKRQF